MGFGSSVMLPSTEVVIRVSDTPSMTSTRLSYQSSYLSQLASVGTEIQQVISPSDIKPITVTYPTTDTGTIQQGKSAFTSTLMGKFSLSVSPSGFEEVDTSLVPNIVSTLERSRASVFSSLSLSQISREVATTSLITPALSIVKSSLAVGTELSIRPSPVESFVETIPAAVRSMSDYIFRSSDLELVASFSVSSTLLDVGGFSSLQSFAAGTSLSTNIIPSQQASVVSVLLPFLSTAALDLSVGYMTETASLVTVTAASLGSPLGMGAISSVMPSPVVTFTDKLPLESSSMLTSVEVISQLPTVPDQYSTSQHFVVNSTEGFSSVTPTLVSVVQSLSTSQPTPLSVDSVDYISFISVTTIVDSVISISSSQESTSADYTSSLRPLNFSTTTQFATTQTSLPVSIIFSSSQESTPTDYTSLLRPIDFTRHFSTTQTSFSAAISSVHQVPMEVVLPLTTSRLFTTALVVKSPSTMDTTLSVHPSPTRTSIGNIVVESASLLTSKEITSYSSTSLSLLMPSSQFPVVSSIVDSSLSGASSSSTVHVPNPFPSPTPTPTPESIIDFADLYPFGDNQGDKRMLPGDDDVSEPIIAPYGFPFFGKIKEKLHICINGFLSLDSEYCSFQPTLLPFINRHSVIAPFWTDIDTRVSQESNLTNGSAVYYHVYSGSQTDAVSREMLSVITRDVRRYSREILDYDIFSDFNASWATVVTWFQVAPYNGYVYQDTELATFQAVAATNGVFSAVLFVYPYNDIQWPSHAEFPAIMGYSSDDYKNFYNHPNSRTSELFQITEEIGNTHRQGRWFFRVDGNTQQLSPPQECVQWYMHQPDPPADLQPCPCTYEQALIDTRYLITFDSLCADRRFPLSDSSGQLCCYSKPPDGLSVLYNSYVLSGAPKGSRYTRYHISDYDNFAAEDLWPFQKCCIESRLCHLYSERRPPLSCKGYIRPGRAHYWGDPHLITLDGFRYTFNGLGEYLLADVDRGVFQAQARTKRAVNRAEGTVFSAIGVKHRSSVPVQVEIDHHNSTAVYINGSRVFLNASLMSISKDFKLDLNSTDNTVKLVHTEGMSVKITPNQDILSITVSLASQYKDKAAALLGNFNDDPSDDLILPNGTLLSSNASEESIFYNFGELWRIKPNESLFIYPPGTNYSTYNDLTFIPNFGPPVFNDSALHARALEVCGGNQECIYDAARTQSIAVGEASLNADERFQQEQILLDQTPPEITAPDVLNMTVNKTLILPITVATEASNTIFKIIQPSMGATISQSGVLNWTVLTVDQEATNLMLQVIATSQSGASSGYLPKINLCDCSNNGTCNFTNVKANGYDNNNLQFVPCDCPAAYSGLHCDKDFNGCANSPCLAGTDCYDNPAPLTGFYCDPCPNGYERDRAKCSDIDECSLKRDGCEQSCRNSPGNFSCLCSQGYVLSNNGKNCTDIDECERFTNCQQVCVNSLGSYQCSCSDGYVLQADGVTCVANISCSTNTCSQMCAVVSGQPMCSCSAGYVLDGNNVTCSACSAGKFGLGCSLDCACQNGAYCHPVSGCNCSSVPGWIGSFCETELNLFKPLFNLSNYVASVAEDAVIGTTVVQVKAEDRDLNQAGEVKFQLAVEHIDKNSIQLFNIDPHSGVIQTVGLLDREKTSRHILAVQATDQGIQSQKSTMTTVVIDVQDINDNTPVFSHGLYTARISESATAGSIVTVVNCNDADSVDGVKLILETSDGMEGIFVIDQNGIIRTSRDIDYEMFNNILLSVRCMDSAEHYAEAHVTVEVLPVNEHGPVFINESLYTVSIPEDLAIGMYVAEVQAIDSDLGLHGTIVYNITDGNIGDHFAIEPLTGKVWLQKSVDFERRSYFNLSVEARDQGLHPETAAAHLEILVSDVNDNNPFFNSSLYISSIPEPLLPNKVVLVTSCSDHDFIDYNGLVIHLIDGNEDGYFAVNSSGVIVNVRELNYEEKTSFALTLQCIDRANHTAYATIVIHLVPVNEHAPIFRNGSYYQLSALENTLPGTVLATVDASDLDRGVHGRITYSITDGNEQDVFGIDQTTGQIWLQKQLDRESVAFYNLTIKAGDGQKTATAYVSVIINDVNDNFPHFSPSLYSANVSENASSSVSVVTVTCLDDDKLDDGKLAFDILSGDLTATFTVGDDGLIEATKPIDYEQYSSFILSVRCQDLVNHSAYAIVVIHVTALNEHAPVFVGGTSFTVSLPENEFIGRQFLTLSAVDADSGKQGAVSYGISSGNSENKFAIDITTGIMWLQAALDRETTPTYHLTVTAYDGGVNPKSASAFVTVSVTDVNDNGPQFVNLPSSPVMLSESSAVGATVLRLSVIDKDIGSQPSLEISGGNLENTFRLDRSIITLNKLVDYEKIPRYSVTITASEQAYPFQMTIAVVTIQLVNVNDNAPVFHPSSSHVSLAENTPLGHTVTTLFATDADGDALTYGTDGSDDTFDVSDAGTVQLRKQLNFRLMNRYEIKVFASDRTYVTNTFLTVHVLDVPVAPKFEKSAYITSVLTNGTYPKTIVQVQATDKDGDHIQYFISRGLVPGFISIDSNTGEIFLLAIPPNQILNYSLTVEALDDSPQSLTSMTNVSISIVHVETETNAFAPEFTQHNYTVNVSELAVMNTLIVIVHAFDMGNMDEVITYELHSFNATDLFTIDPLNGSVTTAVSFSKIFLESQYTLQVMAWDSGAPKLSAAVKLIVHVTSNNHHAPEFKNPPLELSVHENSPITSLISDPIKAVDDDSGLDGEIEYSLLPVNGNVAFMSLFALNRVNDHGELSVNGSINFEDWHRGGDIMILASDKGKVPRTATITIHINIIDVNEPPVFISSNYVAELYVRDNRLGEVIVTVSASDPDSGLAGIVKYTTLGGNAAAFTKISGSSLILADKVTNTGTFILRVQAVDSGTPELRSNIVHVNIDVFGDNYLSSMTLEGATAEQYKASKKRLLNVIAEPFNGTAQEERHIVSESRK
jgi:hypothetical protein